MDGTAIALCEGHFSSPNGKTAHGLVRGTDRYRLLGVIDSANAGRDAGETLDGKPNGIPIFASLEEAAAKAGKPDYMVIGVAPDGGMLPDALRPVVAAALKMGINVDSGLHQMLGDDPEFRAAAESSGARVRDVRRPKPVSELHFYQGRIGEIGSLRVAFLGTDSAIGKRTTAKIVLSALREKGISAEMIGTGQTAWFQGLPFSMILDSTVNDFVAGEIEHAALSAWEAGKPRVMLFEGQGCLTNPAYPGGFEILAAARPQAVVIQHAPRRAAYDGFPDFPLAGLDREKQIIELLSPGQVAAITINHEGMTREETDAAAAELEAKHGVPACDPIFHGPEKIVNAILAMEKGGGK
ncbi:MAG: hypothetical protein BWY28_02862 [bacterium ADurb.Bin236]|nr:MAG: hypothetical protein BWY28_02862 [bacterium ADurb.Bin236]HOY61738.1 DUF1611 domain-containing protein [bacterium]HPN93071.1 DUF1611 domain-containing protein [bacterium]